MKAQLLLLILVLVTARLAAADPEKSARRAADRANAKRALPRATAGPAVEQVLTDEQRQKLREYTQANAETLRSDQKEAVKLRRELQEAVLSGKADEAAIRQKSEAIARLEGEVLAARMAALARVASTLTPEQKEKIKDVSGPLRAARPGLGAGPRQGKALRTPREPAAPPPPEK